MIDFATIVEETPELAIDEVEPQGVEKPPTIPDGVPFTIRYVDYGDTSSRGSIGWEASGVGPYDVPMPGAEFERDGSRYLVDRVDINVDERWDPWEESHAWSFSATEGRSMTPRRSSIDAVVRVFRVSSRRAMA